MAAVDALLGKGSTSPLLRDYLLATGPIGAPGRGLGWQVVTGRPTLTFLERAWLLDIGHYVAMIETSEDGRKSLERTRATMHLDLAEERVREMPDMDDERPANILSFPTIDPATATPEEIAQWRANLPTF